MSLTTRTTVTCPADALAAAEGLLHARRLLNAAEGVFAWSGDAAPYGMADAALERTILAILAGDEGETDLLRAYAALITGETANNGKGVLYQMTAVLGWDVALTHNGNTATTPGIASPVLSDVDVERFVVRHMSASRPA